MECNFTVKGMQNFCRGKKLYKGFSSNKTKEKLNNFIFVRNGGEWPSDYHQVSCTVPRYMSPRSPKELFFETTEFCDLISSNCSVWDKVLELKAIFLEQNGDGRSKMFQNSPFGFLIPTLPSDLIGKWGEWLIVLLLKIGGLEHTYSYDKVSSRRRKIADITTTEFGTCEAKHATLGKRNTLQFEGIGLSDQSQSDNRMHIFVGTYPDCVHIVPVRTRDLAMKNHPNLRTFHLRKKTVDVYKISTAGELFEKPFPGYPHFVLSKDTTIADVRLFLAEMETLCMIDNVYT